MKKVLTVIGSIGNPLYILYTTACVLHRRVHISQSTMDSLHGEFELEQGNGGERCEYLLEKGIETYLVLVPNKKVTNELNGNVSKFQH